MTNRKTTLETGEVYHVYNRGVDKRDITSDQSDSDRFMRSLVAFNTKNPIRTLQLAELNIKSGRTSSEDALVDIVAYCLNPNHFHIILRQRVDGGVSEFMKRLSGGYTWYFNNKYERSGSLFQGKFKVVHIGSDVQLLHTSVYVNLNFRVHGYSGPTALLVRSSWSEYGRKTKKDICNKDLVLGQFRTVKDYQDFSKMTLAGIRERKILAIQDTIEEY